MKPIRLTNTGELLIVPEELGLTDESELLSGGVLGRHDYKGCPGGVVEFHEVLGGWVVACLGCGLRLEVPKEVKTYGALRVYVDKIFKK